MEEVFAACSPGQMICGGQIPEEIYSLASAYHLIDYYKREELVVANAAVTAEAAIGTAMEKGDTVLLGRRVLVLGFGRIGKLLAFRLKAFGAQVTVAARKPSDLAWIRAYGYEGIYMDDLDTQLSRVSLLFNTVPHVLLDKARLSRLPKSALCIDLSSEPGGFDMQAAASLGIDVSIARGLPGKAAPKSAAAIIRDTIYNICSEQEIFL